MQQVGHFLSVVLSSRLKYAIDAVTDNDLTNGFVINRRGAKVYFDIDRQPLLVIKNGHQVFDILSVGLSKEMIPLVTIVEKDEVKCYRIPRELSEWAMTIVGLAKMGEKVFPSKVVFSKTKDGLLQIFYNNSVKQ